MVRLVLWSLCVSLLTAVFLVAPAEAAGRNREIVLLRSPALVKAVLSEKEGHLWSFDLQIAHAGQTGSVFTAFFEETYPDAVRHLRQAVAWRQPYLFVLSECGGGNAWSCDVEHVLRIESGSLAWLGRFVAEGETSASSSYKHGFFLDLYDKLEDKAPLSHAAAPRFPIAFRDRDGHPALDLEETWRINRREVLDVLARDWPAPKETEPCDLRDETRAAAFAQALAIARYCDQESAVAEIFTKAAQILTSDEFEIVDRVGKLVVPGELPVAWRGDGWGEMSLDGD
jgi:hypothetical protein